MMRSYRALPDIPTGYGLETGRLSWFSVIQPIQRTNEITNPSAELATTTGYTAGSGTLTTTTDEQYHGARSFKYTPAAGVNDGFYYTLTSTVAIRAVSCKFLGAAGVPYALTYATSGGVDLATKTFTASGRWQWIWLYYNDASATTRRLYFRKNNSTSVAPFYVDGVQSEVINAGETVSTFISGDELGLLPNQSPPAYYWTGTPHASTSVRSGLTRAGGMVIPMSKYNFILTAIIGLGLAAPQNVSAEYARIDGGYPDYTRKPTRQFTLTGRIDANTPAALDRRRAGLSDLLDRDASALDQEMVLRYEKLDVNDQPVSDAALIRAKYQGGLDGNADNLHAETVPITFTQYLPSIVSEGGAGATLAPQTTVANADYFITRSPTGTWQILGASGANGVVRAIAVAPNGDVYIGGDFLDVGGSGADYIARWDGSAWNTVGGATALNNTVYALAFGPDGTLYVGGAFDNAGGVANADRIATWNGSAWGSLSTGANGAVLCLAVTPTGTLYAGGQFTSIGTSTADFVAYWNGTTWANLASDTAVNNNIYAAVVDAAGNLYIGGDFTNVNGIADADRIAKWNGSAWSALSTGSADPVRALAVAPSGWIYAGGGFTSIGGVTAAHIASWNGVAWSPLGSGITTDVYTLAFIGNELYAGGVIATAGGISVPDGLAIWSGGSWVYTDVDLPSSSTVYSIAAGVDGRLYLGYDQAGTATVASTTTITNPGTARSYPTITIKGPSSGTARIYSIANTTTNRALYFNLTINAGETVTMVLTPDNLSFTSDFIGSVAGSVLPGSNTADWFLNPGSNTITVLSNNSSVTATIYWQPSYTRLDNLTR